MNRLAFTRRFVALAMQSGYFLRRPQPYMIRVISQIVESSLR